MRDRPVWSRLGFLVPSKDGSQSQCMQVKFKNLL
jgi:hypothetical protein